MKNAVDFEAARSKNTALRHADLMHQAGEFLQAAAAVIEYHQIESSTDEGSPFDDRIISGIVSGIQLVGRQLREEAGA